MHIVYLAQCLLHGGPSLPISLTRGKKLLRPNQKKLRLQKQRPDFPGNTVLHQLELKQRREGLKGRGRDLLIVQSFSVPVSTL